MLIHALIKTAIEDVVLQQTIERGYKSRFKAIKLRRGYPSSSD